ncbi:MAG: SpvB/TcaC N-terminal domain-containing protein [Candidatus Omnitrophota bacterium]
MSITPIITVTDANPDTQTITLNEQPYTRNTAVSEEGQYTLSVSAQDKAGNAATKTVTFTIDKTAPVVEAGTDKTILLGERVVFDNSYASDNVGVDTTLWDFGTQGTSYGAHNGVPYVDFGSGVEHTYEELGTFTVTLTVTDTAGNTANDTLRVEVTEQNILPPSVPTVDDVITPTGINSQQLTGTKSEDTPVIIVSCLTADVGDVTYLTQTTWSCLLTDLSVGVNDVTIYAENAEGIASDSIVTSIRYSNPPQVNTLSPTTNSFFPKEKTYHTFDSFFTIYYDADGYENISACHILIGESSDSIQPMAMYYDQNTNKLYLKNDTGDSWIGGFAPGTNNFIENSYFIINCAQTFVSGVDNAISIYWSVIFKPAAVGEKGVYLKAVDDYDISTDWIKKGTYIIEGAMVGENGGVVTSLDGKIKLIIPEGALDVATPISIRVLDKSEYTYAAPQDRTLLKIVKCSPSGQQFNQSVELIYTLDAPEVPGTPVDLGLYKENENEDPKIILYGQQSVVGTDNLTVSFSLLHFSTYAALKGMISQGAPIGSGVQVPLPDMFTGAFSHSVPITIFPGRKGIQPNIALTYRSSNTNSWLGVGFSLNPGYIVRSTRLGPPKYNDLEDTFYFITEGGTTELIHLTDNLYQSKIESSFTKFFKESDDWWKVISKDGSVLEIGKTREAKEISNKGTYSWYITKAIDTNKNYIEYKYGIDSNKCYLQRIDYTGNERGVYPLNRIEFFTESRNDVISSYISGSKITIAKRLKEIYVKSNSKTVWIYKLNYETGPDTNRSRLKRVEQYADDGKQMPVQTFGYQNAR